MLTIGAKICKRISRGYLNVNKSGFHLLIAPEKKILLCAILERKMKNIKFFCTNCCHSNRSKNSLITLHPKFNFYHNVAGKSQLCNILFTMQRAKIARMTEDLSRRWLQNFYDFTGYTAELRDFFSRMTFLHTNCIRNYSVCHIWRCTYLF